MPQEILDIILSAVSILVTGLVSWGVGLLINLINSKIKDQKVAAHLAKITQIITDAVMNVFQSFVDTLKKNGKFDKDAQLEAKERAISIVMNQLTPELKDYITSNYGDLRDWISNKVEAVIYSLKSANKA